MEENLDRAVGGVEPRRIEGLTGAGKRVERAQRARWCGATALRPVGWASIARTAFCPLRVTHTREGIRKHSAAHKGGIKPLCAARVS